MTYSFNNNDLNEFVNEVKYRYVQAQNNNVFDFKNEIEPFLNEAILLSDYIKEIKGDHFYNDSTKEKLSQQITELAMACHKKELKSRIYNEKLKFITMWFNYINRERLT